MNIMTFWMIFIHKLKITCRFYEIFSNKHRPNHCNFGHGTEATRIVGCKFSVLAFDEVYLCRGRESECSHYLACKARNRQE